MNSRRHIKRGFGSLTSMPAAAVVSERFPPPTTTTTTSPAPTELNPRDRRGVLFGLTLSRFTVNDLAARGGRATVPDSPL